MRYALELRLNPLEGALQGPQVGLPRLCGSRCGGDGSRCGGQKRTSVVGMSVWMGVDGCGWGGRRVRHRGGRAEGMLYMGVWDGPLSLKDKQTHRVRKCEHL